MSTIDSTVISTTDSNAASVCASTSRKKLTANRRYARRSTAPRTEAGKRAASMNARSHGLFCHDLILPGEDREAFIQLWNSIQSTLRAENLLELSLLSRFVQAQWKLLRVQSADAALHETAEREIVEKAQKQLLRLTLEEQSYPFGMEPDHKALNETRRLRTQTVIEQTSQGNIPAGAVLAASLRRVGGACSGARERLSQYEHRIESSGMRALSMLLKLREQMKKQTSEQPSEPPPYLLKGKQIADDPSLEQAVDEMQNEPTADESVATDGAAESCEAPPCDTGVPPVLSADALSTVGTAVSRPGGDEAPAEGSG